MNKTTLFTLSLLTLVTQGVAAEQQSHRLAFSKANNVEVFVDYDANNEWCSAELAMRFAFTTATTDLAVVDSLLPKLGVLLDSQCAAAEHVAWQAVAKAGDVTARGEATKVSGWQSILQTNLKAEEAEQAKQAEVAKQAEEVKQVETAKQAAEAKLAETAKQAEEAKQAEAAKQAEEAKQAEAAKQAEEGKQAEAAKQAEQAKQAEAAKPMVVAGWQPKSPEQALNSGYKFTELTDSNGCKYRFKNDFNLGQQPFTINSTASCDDQGYAHGVAQIEIVRSDGKLLYNDERYFLYGIPFEKEHQLPLVDMDKEGNAILLLSQDPENEYYYIIKASPEYRSTWSMGNKVMWGVDEGNVYLLTEHEDDFRKANSIKVAALGAASAYEKHFVNQRRYSFYAATDMDAGVISKDREHLLYQVNVDKERGSNQWNLDLNRATNYLFQKEERLAREKEREEQRLAQEKKREEQRLAQQRQRELDRVALHAERQLQTHQRYLDSQQDLEQMIENRTNNIFFNKENTQNYQRLMQGEAGGYQQVVHIAKEAKGEHWLDYPYQAVISDTESSPSLNKGWYFIAGHQTLDTSRKDEQGFPLTSIKPTQVYECDDKGCQDFFTPLNLTRLEYDDPNWTPEQAKQQVQAAEEARNGH